MVVGALLSVAVAIALLIASLLPGGGPALAALSLAADAVAATCLAVALRRRRSTPPNGPAPSGPPTGPMPGALPPGHLPRRATDDRRA